MPADDRSPNTPRRLILHTLGSLLATLLLYLFAVGPYFFFHTRSELKRRSPEGNFYIPFEPPAFYAPLFATARGTPAEGILNPYCGWWIQLAIDHQDSSEPLTSTE